MKKNYTLRLNDQDRERLETIAGEKGVRLSVLISLVLQHYLKNHKKIKLT